MLVGRPLFVGTSREKMAQILFREIPRPRDLRRDVPADLEAVAMKLLANARNDRYASAEQAIEALARCKDAPTNGRGELARLLASRFPRESAQPELPTELDQQAHPSRPWGWLALAAGVGIAAAVVVAFVTHDSSREASHDAMMVSVQAPAVVPARDAGLDATAVVHAAASPAPPARDAGVDATAVVMRSPADAAIAELSGPRTVHPAAPSTPPTPRPASPSPSDVHAEKGDLMIAVDPFAEVWLDGVSLGTTPIHKQVSVGKHHVLLVNTTKHKRESHTVTVTTTQQVLIEESW